MRFRLSEEEIARRSRPGFYDKFVIYLDEVVPCHYQGATDYNGHILVLLGAPWGCKPHSLHKSRLFTNREDAERALFINKLSGANE